MLQVTHPGDYTIWVVAFLLFAIDSARMLSVRELLIVEDRHGKLYTPFTDAPFTIVGKPLYLCPLHLPHRPVFIAAWGKPWVSTEKLTAVLDGLAEVRRILIIPALLASWAFILLFVAGPLLTFWLGPNAAVIYTAASVYPSAVACVLSLWMNRQDLNLTTAKILWIGTEMLVCPAFLPNAVRKVTCARAVDADAAQLLLAAAPMDVKEEFVRRLERITEETLEALDPQDSEWERLRSYIADVRAAL